MEYTVTWKIELTADSPQDAARKALEIQRDYNSIATVFDVQTSEITDTKNRPVKWKNIDASGKCICRAESPYIDKACKAIVHKD